jgi:hypothetical protein
MNAEETLGTIAQIGVSLAGFAGIVGALAGEKFRPTHPEVWYPFWALIASGLGVMFVALLPLLLQHLQVSDRGVWVASSSFLFVLTAGNLAFFLPRILRAARVGAFRRIRAVAVPVDSASMLVLVTQALNAFGVGFEQSVSGFLIGLYLLLLVSTLNFAFLLYVLGRAPNAPTEG